MAQGFGRQRERDPERRPLALGRAHRRDTALGHHQRAHDGQAQSAAPGGARPGLVRPVEALEHPACLLLRHAWSLVGHVEDHGRGVVARLRVEGPGADRYLDRGPVRGVRERVAHQVPDDLPQPRLVADDQERGARLDRQVDGPGRRQQPRVVHRVGGQREHVDRLPGQRPLLVQPGQQQQVLDEQAHPGGFLLHPDHDPVQVTGCEPGLCRGSASCGISGVRLLPGPGPSAGPGRRAGGSTRRNPGSRSPVSAARGWRRR